MLMSGLRSKRAFAAVSPTTAFQRKFFATPSTKMANMPISGTKSFGLLLATFEPLIMIAHDVPAAQHLQGWGDDMLITCPHLSRAGYSVADNVIEQIGSLR